MVPCRSDGTGHSSDADSGMSWVFAVTPSQPCSRHVVADRAHTAFEDILRRARSWRRIDRLSLRCYSSPSGRGSSLTMMAEAIVLSLYRHMPCPCCTRLQGSPIFNLANRSRGLTGRSAPSVLSAASQPPNPAGPFDHGPFGHGPYRSSSNDPIGKPSDVHVLSARQVKSLFRDWPGLQRGRANTTRVGNYSRSALR